MTFNYHKYNPEKIILKLEEEEIAIIPNKTSICIKDCFHLKNRDEIKQVSMFVEHYVKEVEGKDIKSSKDIFGELMAHVVCYNLGIAKAQTVDADIDFGNDPRWYVNLLSKFFKIFY